jgi:two-component system, cell cycle response regulator
MPLPHLLDRDDRHSANCRTPLSNQRSKRRVLSIGEGKRVSRETLEEMLSSGFLGLDGELGHLLYEVDGISGSNALERAVWCVVKQALLNSELRSLALTDDLTGLHNRRGFLASVTQQLKLARRNAQTLLLFFFDVDNFKQINDCYGHQVGDLALVRVADALERTFRDSDVLARFGGDEFAVLALEASQNHQEGILGRLKESLKKLNREEFRYQLSLSMGVARFDPKHPVPIGELMTQADQAMYEQKRGRRDFR